MVCELIAAGGVLVGIAGTAYAIANHRDALRYRRLDQPRATLVTQHRSCGSNNRMLQLRVVNDDKGLWSLHGVSVASPGGARLSHVGTPHEDGHGGVDGYEPLDWKQNLSIEDYGGYILTTHIDQPLRLIVTLAGKSDRSIQVQSQITLPAIAS